MLPARRFLLPPPRVSLSFFRDRLPDRRHARRPRQGPVGALCDYIEGIEKDFQRRRLSAREPGGDFFLGHLEECGEAPRTAERFGSVVEGALVDALLVHPVLRAG